MKVFHGRSEGVLSEQRGATFTGSVWADPIMPTTDNVTLLDAIRERHGNDPSQWLPVLLAEVQDRRLRNAGRAA